MSTPETPPGHALPADSVTIRELPLARPLVWLAMGWRDLLRAPGASLLHGLLVAVGGWVILVLTLRWWYLLPGAFRASCWSILSPGCTNSRRLAVTSRPRWPRCSPPARHAPAGLAGPAWRWPARCGDARRCWWRCSRADRRRGLLRHIVLSQGSNLFPLWLMADGLGIDRSH
jgi:hypothetical protein